MKLIPPGDVHPKRYGASTESQPQGKPDPDFLPLWSALADKAVGPISITWSHLWGTPKAVYGILSAPMEVSEAVDAIRTILKNRGFTVTL